MPTKRNHGVNRHTGQLKPNGKTICIIILFNGSNDPPPPPGQKKRFKSPI